MVSEPQPTYNRFLSCHMGAGFLLCHSLTVWPHSCPSPISPFPAPSPLPCKMKELGLVTPGHLSHFPRLLMLTHTWPHALKVQAAPW